jgi:hypothetical protein
VLAHVVPGGGGGGGNAPPDTVGTGGALQITRAADGRLVVAMSADARSVFVSGTRSYGNDWHRRAPRPWLDRLQIEDTARTRLLDSPATLYEDFVVALDADFSQVVVTRQSATVIEDAWHRDLTARTERKLTSAVDVGPEVSRAQARAIEANALHQQQETTMMVADRVHRQLGSVMGLLWMSSQATSTGSATDEQVGTLWNQLGAGDPESFARQMMALYFRAENPDSARELFVGTEVRARHSRTIRDTFGRLLVKVRACDSDGVIEDALLGGSNGRIYQIIGELDPQAVR